MKVRLNYLQLITLIIFFFFLRIVNSFGSLLGLGPWIFLPPYSWALDLLLGLQVQGCTFDFSPYKLKIDPLKYHDSQS